MFHSHSTFEALATVWQPFYTFKSQPLNATSPLLQPPPAPTPQPHSFKTPNHTIRLILTTNHNQNPLYPSQVFCRPSSCPGHLPRHRFHINTPHLINHYTLKRPLRFRLDTLQITPKPPSLFPHLLNSPSSNVILAFGKSNGTPPLARSASS